MSDYYIGVDGGGTRTRVLLENAQGREIGRGGGPGFLANPAQPEIAALRVADVVHGVAEEAGVPLPVRAVWAALAGTGRETTRSGVENELGRLALAERVGVGTDVGAIFHDAFPVGPGIVVVAGTGSVAWGRSEDGLEGRVGGWGSIIGDEGSGYGIGVESLRRVARSIDRRGPETKLQEAILRFLSLEAPDELVVWANDATKGDIAGLVPVVAEQARAGDAVAGEVLVKAVEELEGHVLTLLEGLGPWSEPPRVALGGGLLGRGGPLRAPAEKILRAHHLRVTTHDPSPLRGAVALARRLG